MKSYVTIEQHVCRICTKVFDTGALLLDGKVREIFDKYTLTNMSTCQDCEELLKTHVALVAIDIDKSEKLPNGSISPKGAYRLGACAFVKKEVAEQMIKDHKIQDMAFVDMEVINLLNNLNKKIQEPNKEIKQ